MNGLDPLLAKLSGVRKTGDWRYIAKCPAHDDKSPSLAVTQKDGKILLHCFSGCEVGAVLDAVGMEFADLYPERIQAGNRTPLKFSAYDVLKCLKDEAVIIALAASDCTRGIPFSESDLRRVQAAYERIEDAVALVWGRK